MATAKKTPAKKTAAKKTAAKKTAAKTSAAKKSAAKKAPAKKSASKTNSAKPAKQTSQCWPGFEPVPGKAPMTKGSCKPKKHQTPGEKKADSRAAAGSKLQKAGGNKAKANKS